MQPKLTLGPILFHWPAGKWKDFYFEVADEMPVDRVYVGEVVCSKRAPFYEPLYAEVAERLQKAGKEVVFSTLSEVTIKHDRKNVESICSMEGVGIEANDASALWHLSDRPHMIGPFLNVYNEDAMTVLARKGATHFSLNPEIPAQALAQLGKAAKKLKTSLEVQVFGRMPLALSARCYHARAHGRIKDNCQFVCGEDPDGMDIKTLDGKPFLTVNGIQTMSYTCLNLVQELEDLQKMGFSYFRISPHSGDMTKTARTFRAALENKITPEEALSLLGEANQNFPFTNGFYHKTTGYSWKG
jgi:collagenase-like PrtC family protease